LSHLLSVFDFSPLLFAIGTRRANAEKLLEKNYMLFLLRFFLWCFRIAAASHPGLHTFGYRGVSKVTLLKPDCSIEDKRDDRKRRRVKSDKLEIAAS
jgi:hypothetical protein